MSLPWIKVHVDVPVDEKSDALADLLGDPRAWTHVVELWMWAAKVHPDGDLSRVRRATVARRSGYTGDADVYVDALIESGWLDQDGRIHAWDTYQGAHAKKLQRDRERIAKRRADVSRDSRADVAATVARERRGEERRGDQNTQAAELEPGGGGPSAPPAVPAESPEAEPIDPRALIAGEWDDRPRSAVAADPRYRAALAEIADRCWGTGGRRDPQSKACRSAVRRMLLSERMTPSEAAMATAGLGLSDWARSTGNTTWEHLGRQAARHLNAYIKHRSGRDGRDDPEVVAALRRSAEIRAQVRAEVASGSEDALSAPETDDQDEPYVGGGA